MGIFLIFSLFIGGMIFILIQLYKGVDNENLMSLIGALIVSSLMWYGTYISFKWWYENLELDKIVVAQELYNTSVEGVKLWGEKCFIQYLKGVEEIDVLDEKQLESFICYISKEIKIRRPNKIAINSAIVCVLITSAVQIITRANLDINSIAISIIIICILIVTFLVVYKSLKEIWDQVVYKEYQDIQDMQNYLIELNLRKHKKFVNVD